jgi:serine/threonine protein kinase
MSAESSLLGTILDDQSSYMPTPINQGGYFEVYIITSKELLEASFLHGTDKIPSPPLPKAVAVKSPKVRGKLNDRRNQKLWTSMATELQILKHELVKDHEIVVKLLGLCWRSFRAAFMPAFVLEAARSDLYSMIQSFEFTLDKMSTRTILGLAVDICSGLSILHEVGIIHGDMKPQNVLIFEDPKLRFVAKITNFGSSLLKTDIKEPIVLSYNTDFWQAPECQRALDGAQLIQADTFSPGLVLSYMLSRGFMLELWKAGNTRQDLEGEDIDEHDRYTIRAAKALQLTLAAALEADEEKLYGPISSRKPEGAPKEDEDEEFDENETHMSIRKIQRGVLRTIIPSFFGPSLGLRSSAKSIHQNIRICLS